MGRVEGKIALVTGAARGIGKGAARLLAVERAIVALTDILDDEGEEAAAAIRSEGGAAAYRHLDVSNEHEVRRVIDEVAEEFDGLDVLVNNAGIAGANKPTHELTEEEWDAVQRIKDRATRCLYEPSTRDSSVLGLRGPVDARQNRRADCRGIPSGHVRLPDTCSARRGTPRAHALAA